MRATKRNQQGFSLFMVMIMMIVIALLVVLTSQTTSTESRLSTNEADRKYALAEAEVGLRDAEELLNKIYDELVKRRTAGTAGTSLGLMEFKEDCTGSVLDSKIVNDRGGLCTAIEKPNYVQPNDDKVFIVKGTASKAVHEREVKGKLPFDDNARSLESSDGKANYVIEYLGQRENETSSGVLDYFRVTSRANGQNENTQVILQSYVEMAREY